MNTVALPHTELKGNFAMSSTKKALHTMSIIVARLDGSPMHERDREIAKAYLHKTEAILDVIWFVGATIRTAIAGVLAIRSNIGTGVSRQKRIQTRLQ